jgi:glycosyltransferase involved in cell wall biosynthesis
MAATPARETIQPLVSIVIPCYDVGPYVQAAVESALDQTWPHLEVIAVEDGARDNTLAVLRKISSQRSDQRLRIVSQPNRGLSAARNTGIRESRGRFIGFLDGDDIWMPDKVDRQMAILLSRPQVGLTFSHSLYLDEAGRPTGRTLAEQRLRPALADMVRRNHFGNGSTVIARRECFEQAGFFDEDLHSCEDYEMWCRILALTSLQAQGVAEPLTGYRLRSTSLTFDHYRFARNADLAMDKLRKGGLGLSDALLRAGHAMHYRIAAWRALLAGRDSAARALMLQALRLYPQIVLSDLRTAAAIAAMLVPHPARRALEGALSSWRTRRPLPSKLE